MKKQFSVLLTLFACFYFISCKKESVTTPDNQSTSNATLSSKINAGSKTNSVKVPFKGSYSTTAQIQHGPPILQQTITGTGNATHLGESVFVATVTVNLTTPPPFQVNGTTTFTAANGDQFYTIVTGTNTPTGNGTSRADLLHTIVGGTGRFVNASGSFTGIALNNQANSTNTVVFDGYISY
ncbi:MAG TPA: hypothetical protein VGP55_09050 [Chitinophagaceae bacterium]|nr:hypothetical protein [Chitinophagaceae bacterium]